jgi:hypothetical protein
MQSSVAKDIVACKQAFFKDPGGGVGPEPTHPGFPGPKFMGKKISGAFGGW